MQFSSPRSPRFEMQFIELGGFHYQLFSVLIRRAAFVYCAKERHSQSSDLKMLQHRDSIGMFPALACTAHCVPEVLYSRATKPWSQHLQTTNHLMLQHFHLNNWLILKQLLFYFLFSFFIVSTSYRLDFRHFLDSCLRSSPRIGWTHEWQSMSVT